MLQINHTPELLYSVLGRYVLSFISKGTIHLNAYFLVLNSKNNIGSTVFFETIQRVFCYL